MNYKTELGQALDNAALERLKFYKQKVKQQKFDKENRISQNPRPEREFIRVNHKGKLLTLTDLSRITGIKLTTISQRYHDAGLRSYEDLTKPVLKRDK